MNKYDLTGEYGVGYALNTGEPFYFDLEDYDKIKDFTWGARHDTRKGRRSDIYYIEARYCFTADGKKRSKRIHLHHFVLGIDDRNLTEKVLVDHKNQVPHDCRKDNLHLADLRINNINRPKQTSNTSGIIGVHYDEEEQAWIARINTELGKREIAYHGNSKQDAIVARLVAECKYYGESAPQKKLFEKYGITEEFVQNFPQRSYKVRTNTSGVTGVSLNYKKWLAYIRINGKQTVLGSFKDKKDAIKVRLEAEKKYMEERFWQKELWEEYGIEDD